MSNPADWLADQGTGQGIPGCDQPAPGATVDATDTAEEMALRVAAKTNPDERTLIQRMEAALTVLD